MAGDDKLNGSVDLLAQAMRQVFAEAVEGAVEPLTTEVKALRTETRDIRETMATKQDVKRLEADMEAGFSGAAEERRRLRSDMENGFAELKPPEPDAQSG